MIALPVPLVGIICLLAAFAITFFWPLGPSRRNHLASEIVILVLFVATGGFIFASGWLPDGVSWLGAMGIGFVVGLVAVILRDVRRFIQHFRYETYKYTHPYYWYGRVGRAMFGGSARRRRRR
jgi:uncharacterized membrane protein YedE/YeeE